jgi:hypothetical protein
METALKAPAARSARQKSEFAPLLEAVRVDLPASVRLSADGNIPIRIQNLRDVAGAATLSVYLGSGAGVRRIDEYRAFELQAGATQQLTLLAADLALPAGHFDVAGGITLDVEVEYEDGITLRRTAQPLYFQPEGDGFLVYDQATRDARPDHGLLTQQARFVQSIAPDAMIVNSYIAPDNDPNLEPPMPVGGPAPPAELSDDEMLERMATMMGLTRRPVPTLRDSKDHPVSELETNASTVTTKFCFQQLTNFNDSSGCPDSDGICEDAYQKSGNVNRTNIGNIYEVYGPVTCGASGCTTGPDIALAYLGDGFGTTTQGCAPASVSLTAGLQYIVQIWSAGKVANSGVSAADAFVGDAIAPIATLFTVPSAPAAITNLVQVPVRFDVAQNAYVAISFGMSRMPPIVSIPNIIMHINDNGDTFASGTDRQDVQVARIFAQSKMLMGHEFGHEIMLWNINETTTNTHYDLSDTGNLSGNPMCNSAADSHSFKSREFTSAAVDEALASFWSAGAFNLNNQNDDCWVNIPDEFNKSGSTVAIWVDCGATGTTQSGFVTTRPWLNKNCKGSGTGSDPLAGRGNEADWLRAFWDLRTLNASRPSVAQIYTWIKTANDTTSWQRDNWFQLLDAEANDTVNNPAALNTTWDSVKVGTGIGHGINH